MKQKTYQLNRKIMIILSILSIVFLIVGFAIINTKLLYPYHFSIGISIMILSIITLIYAFSTYFKILEKIELLLPAQNYILEHKGITSIIAVVLLIAIIAFNVAPVTKNPFKKLSPNEISLNIKSDVYLATGLLDRLEVTGYEIVNSELILKETLSAEERDGLQKEWINFLLSVNESEKLIETYRFFHFVSPISQPEEHIKSFMIAYSLYLKKYEVISAIMNKVQTNEPIKKIFNEKTKLIDEKNIYSNMTESYYHPKTILKINLGQGYLKSFIEKLYEKNNIGNGYIILKESAKKDYLLLKDRLGDTVINSIEVGSDNIEKGLFDVWFPIQKNVAKSMGHTYLSRRENKLITIDQIHEMEKLMEPGDIMLQRRNWYGSNVGIPGFWAHAALYTGNLEKMNQYFGDEFSEKLKKDFPSVYEKFNEKRDGFVQAVIEGKEPGIILQPLEVSARADYLVVLRPKLNKEEKMRSLFRAFESFGKPYDFNFDFETRDAMVCSELVYDAYQKTSKNRGINFPLSLMNGRMVMAPIDIARKFANEYQKDIADLEFVYFLDGDEASQVAKIKGVEEFVKTPERPKFSFFLD